MATSIVDSLDFDEDVVISSTNCWRYSEDDEQNNEHSTGGGGIESSTLNTDINNVVIKKETTDDDSSKITTVKSNPPASVGCVTTIKDKSKAEREYTANAVKKVRDLLRNSEFIDEDDDEADFAYNQTENDRLDQDFHEQEANLAKQYQQSLNNVKSVTQKVTQYQQRLNNEKSGYSINQADNDSLTQEATQGQSFFASTNSSQHITNPPSQYVENSFKAESSSSSVSVAGSSSAVFSSGATNINYQDIPEECAPTEQIIKLIHTSDATLPYMCSACNMHSSNLGVMKQHIADHKRGVIKCPLLGLSKNTFICPFGNCDFSSPNYARVLTHLNRFHGREAQHLIKQITSATLPEAVAALNDPVSPICKRESIWKEVSLQKKQIKSKVYACSECPFRDYDYKTVIEHLQGHVNQNKKQKTC